MAQVLSDLEQLGFDYVDLVLLHGPNKGYDEDGVCDERVCAFNRAQWRAYSELQVLRFFRLHARATAL